MAAPFRIQSLAPPTPSSDYFGTLFLFQCIIDNSTKLELMGERETETAPPNWRWINTGLPLEVVDGIFSTVFKPDCKVTPQHVTPFIFSSSCMRQYLRANQNKMSVLDFSSMDSFRWFFEMCSYLFLLINFFKRNSNLSKDFGISLFLSVAFMSM